MDQIYIDPQKLIDTASSVEGYKRTIKDTIDYIGNQVTQLCQTDWVSNASEETRKKMQDFSKKFADFERFTQAYAQFLKDAAERYKKTDNDRLSNLNGVENGSTIVFE